MALAVILFLFLSGPEYIGKGVLWESLSLTRLADSKSLLISGAGLYVVKPCGQLTGRC
jgi:hypothetical protein